MDVDNNKKTSWFNTPQGEKVSFWALIGITLAIVLIAFFSFQSSLKSPFISWQKSLLEGAGNNQTALPSEQEISELQKKDTDQDGLSDFEELYVYGTSPYLEDTDSDKINDKQEIDAGTDPNCPEGKDCGSIISPTTPVKSLDAETSGLPSADEIDAQQLRVLLKQAGISKDILDQTDDQTLLEVYQNTLDTTGGTGLEDLTAGASQTGVGQSSNPADMLDYFKSLSASELRQLMISQGADAAQLNAIDDETLKAMVIQALEEEISK